ncbi:unnamed protein product, partial [Rotaria sp. Silwood1]
MSYGVEDNSLLELVDPNMKFRSCNNTGNRFVDVCSTKGLKQAEWSRIAPRWRRAGHGLCFEGQCLNKECEAYRHTVIMPIGYQKFDILIDTDQETTICPLCKYYVEPVACGFSNCWWRYEGIKICNSGPPKRCSSDWKHADDAYHRFDENPSEHVTWRKLIFEVVKKRPNLEPMELPTTLSRPSP